MNTKDHSPNNANPYRILSLEGGGSKGFYTLGVLREMEGFLNRPLCEHFNLVFGTSAGAITYNNQYSEVFIIRNGPFLKNAQRAARFFGVSLLQSSHPTEKFGFFVFLCGCIEPIIC